MKPQNVSRDLEARLEHPRSSYLPFMTQQTAPQWRRTFPKECKPDWLEFEQVFAKNLAWHIFVMGQSIKGEYLKAPLIR
jgi:hypothetical protein